MGQSVAHVFISTGGLVVDQPSVSVGGRCAGLPIPKSGYVSLLLERSWLSGALGTCPWVPRRCPRGQHRQVGEHLGGSLRRLWPAAFPETPRIHGDCGCVAFTVASENRCPES